MSNFYCEYCGKKFTSIAQLTSSFCPKHLVLNILTVFLKESINFTREAKSLNIFVNIAERNFLPYNRLQPHHVLDIQMDFVKVNMRQLYKKLKNKGDFHERI